MALPSDVKFALIPPNWSNPYTVTYQFKTDIITSRAGVEQRRALRMVPRKRLSFTTNPTDAELRSFKTVVAYNQGLRYAVPEVTDSVSITSTLVAYQDTFDVAEVPGWLVAGAYVALELQGKWRQANVISVTGNTVHVLVGLDNAGGGGRIYPLRFGRLATSLSSTRKTATVAEYAIDFEVDPTTETYGDPFSSSRFGGRTPTYHLSVEVFPLRPNWSSDLSITNDVVVDRVDYNGAGPIQTYMPNQYPRRTIKGTFLSRSRANADDLRRFFFRMKGQRGVFFMPTWERDLELVAPIAPGDTTIHVDGTDTATLKGIAGFSNLALITATSIIPCNITNMVVDALNGATVMTLMEPLPATLNPDEVLMVCWLPLCRCAGDDLTIAWQTDEVATFDFTVKTLDDVVDTQFTLWIAGLPVSIYSNPVEME